MEAPRVRIQVEVKDARIWVAADLESTFAELAKLVAVQYAKVTGLPPIVVTELTLRGAILDKDEKVGFWVKDQELLYASAVSASNGSAGDAKKSAPNTPAPVPPVKSTSQSHLAKSPGKDTPAPGVSAKTAQPGATNVQEKRVPEAKQPHSEDGALLVHESPLQSVMELRELSSQAMGLLILGDKGTGKTTLTAQFVGGDAVKNLEKEKVSGQGTTSPVTWEKKIEVDSVVHKVIVVDTDYAHLEDKFFQGAHGFVVLFDVTNRASFECLKERLLGLIVAARGHEPHVPVTLVANKCDCENRVISMQESVALAKELATLMKGSVALYEVSAISGTNVVAAMQDTFLNILHWRACDKNNAEGGWCVVQ